MTTCRRMRRRLVAYLDDELAPAEATAVTDHVSTCEACAAHLDALAATTPSAPTVELDDAALHSIHLHILDALDAEPEPAPARPAAPRGLLHELLATDVRVPRGLVMLYAALLMAMLGWAASGSLQSAEPSDLAEQETDPPVRASLELPPPAAYTPSDGWF